MRLSPLKRTPNEKPFAVVDIETMKWTKFIVLGFYDGLRYLEFRRLSKFFKFIADDTDVPQDIYAHFGGKFDFLFFIRELLKDVKTYKIVDLIPRGSSILCFRIECAGRTFDFRDSSALLPFSLKSITENFGTDTTKGDYDHSKTKGYSKELSDYLRRDCVGLYESLEKFFQWPLIKRAGPASTLASQAMRVFRTYLKNELYSPGNFANNFARHAYLGGRTEIFNPLCRKGPLYEYDVNSLYPFVMRDNFFPTGKVSTVFKYDEEKLGIYWCHVEAPEMHIPALGIISNSKYIFPTGNFTGHFTSAEIAYARGLGYKFKIRTGIIFENKEKLFTDFINDLYSIRVTAQKNSVSDIIAKLLMNSSYGRFGMNLLRENIGFELKAGVTPYKILKLGKINVQLYKEPTELQSFIHVAIAAFVTSYARIHMHRLMAPLGDTLYYTDTDSIFTTSQMETGKNLGDLKHEGTYDSAVFLLPKTYYALGTKKNKIAMKGFDKKKIQNFELDDFKNALEGDLRKFRIMNEPKFATLKQALAQNKIVTLTKKNEKQLKAVYDKRTIIKLKRGEFKTVPIHMKGN